MRVLMSEQFCSEMSEHKAIGDVAFVGNSPVGQVDQEGFAFYQPEFFSQFSGPGCVLVPDVQGGKYRLSLFTDEGDELTATHDERHGWKIEMKDLRHGLDEPVVTWFETF